MRWQHETVPLLFHQVPGIQIFAVVFHSVQCFRGDGVKFFARILYIIPSAFQLIHDLHQIRQSDSPTTIKY